MLLKIVDGTLLPQHLNRLAKGIAFIPAAICFDAFQYGKELPRCLRRFNSEVLELCIRNGLAAASFSISSLTCLRLEASSSISSLLARDPDSYISRQSDANVKPKSTTGITLHARLKALIGFMAENHQLKPALSQVASHRGRL